MAFAHSAIDDRALARSSARPRTQPGLFRRLLNSLIESRRAQVERDIALYLRTSGKFTDEAEREIERRFLSHQSRW